MGKEEKLRSSKKGLGVRGPPTESYASVRKRPATTSQKLPCLLGSQGAVGQLVQMAAQPKQEQGAHGSAELSHRLGYCGRRVRS